MRRSKYRIKDSLTAEEVLAVLGISTEEDFEMFSKMVKQTDLYKHWEKTGNLEWFAQESHVENSPRNLGYENI